MIFLTAIPAITNVYDFVKAGWWSNPSTSREYLKIMPDYWIFIYPITYYFIGCYLKEFPIKMSKKKNIILYIIATLIFGIYNFWHSYNGNYFWGMWQNSESILVLASAVLLFNYFINRDYSNVPNVIKHLLPKLSDLVLGAYLISYIFDDYIIKKIVAMEPDMTHRLEYIIIEVPLVLVLSYLSSLLIDYIYKLISKIVLLVHKKESKEN